MLLLISISESNETKISCRVKKYKRKAGCDLKKIEVYDEKANFYLDPKPTESIKTLRIDNEIVHYLPKSLMTNFQQLADLVVKESQLKEINKSTFENAVDLEEIILEKNELTELKVDTFNGLKKLKTLNLAHNLIRDLHSKTFVENQAMESLSLEFNKIEKVHKNTFKTLKNLKHLSLANNKVIELREETFSENSHLMSVDFSNNKLKYIFETVFTIPNGNLKKIALTGNECIDDEFHPKLDTELDSKAVEEKLVENCSPFPLENYAKEVKILTEKIDELVKKSNVSEREHEAEIDKLNQFHESSLDYLELTLNKTQDELEIVKDINHEVIIHQKYLRAFFKNCSQELEGVEKDRKNYLNKLIEYEIKKVANESQNSGEIAELRTIIDELNVRNYELNAKSSFFDFTCQSETKDSCSAEGLVVPFDNMSLKNFDSLEGESKKSLTIFDSFMTFLPSNLFEVFANLVNVEISSSKVRFINEKTFLAATSVEQFNFTNNLISNLPENAFAALKNLRFLNLEGNRIQTLDSSAFKGLNLIEKLFLRSNSIEEIPNGLFSDLLSLKVISLANNKIKHLNGQTFEHNLNLEIILINKNPLKTIGGNLLDKCPRLRFVNFGNTVCMKDPAHSTNKQDFEARVSMNC